MCKLPAVIEQVSCSVQVTCCNRTGIVLCSSVVFNIEAYFDVRKGREPCREMDVQKIQDVQNYNIVYYKRNDCNQWRGPGTVIGCDGKQIIVKHGGTYARVHVFV